MLPFGGASSKSGQSKDRTGITNNRQRAFDFEVFLPARPERMQISQWEQRDRFDRWRVGYGRCAAYFLVER